MKLLNTTEATQAKDNLERLGLMRIKTLNEEQERIRKLTIEARNQYEREILEHRQRIMELKKEINELIIKKKIYGNS